MTFLSDIARDYRATVGSRSGAEDSSHDDFASPLDRYPNYEGPAPAVRRPSSARGAPDSQQQVWNAIARRHPRKFARAISHMKWLERMEKRYASRILP